MTKIYVNHIKNNKDGIIRAYSETWDPLFLIKNTMLDNKANLSVFDTNWSLLVEIQQLNVGIFPKFVIKSNKKTIGSIGISIQLIDFIYVKKLSWLISGNVLNNHYVISHNTKIIGKVHPVYEKNAMYNCLEVKKEDNLATMVGIVCLLNRWINLNVQIPNLLNTDFAREKNLKLTQVHFFDE